MTCLKHDEHEHQHGPRCGHDAVHHEGHTDYLHDGHVHHVHDGHVGEHWLPDTAAPAPAPRLLVQLMRAADSIRNNR